MRSQQNLRRSLGIGTLIAGVLIVGLLWAFARPDPRLVYTEECRVPSVSSAEAPWRANMALSDVQELLRNAPAIYGPYNRAEQRAIELGQFFGVPMTDNAAYHHRIRAAFAELSLIWDLAIAKGLSPCSTQRLVPDHRADSLETATAKLRALAHALSDRPGS